MRAQALEDFTENLFFAGVSATGDQYWRAGCHTNLCEQGRDIERGASSDPRGIKFQIANHMNPFRAAANRLKAFSIRLHLAANAGKGLENLFEEKGPLFVAAKRTFGEPCVHEKDGSADLACAPEKVRP